MVLVQKWPFFQLFFLGNIGQENVFYDILERKNALLGYKKKKLKKSKIDIFPKGLTNRFGPKMAIFWTFFFLGNRSQEDVFSDILERKNAFLGYKHKRFKKSKNSRFFKGVNLWFWSKNGHFFYFFCGGNICQHFVNFFFLGKKGQENVYYDILERKNVFLGYKNKKFKNSNNWHFSKGVNPSFWSKNGHFWNLFV